MPKIRKKSLIHENADSNITCDFGDGDISRFRSQFIWVRGNIHLGGQTEFCPNGEHNLFVMRPRQGEKNNNELLQCLFLTVVDYTRWTSPLLPHPKCISGRSMDTCSVRGDTVSQTNVLSFARIKVVYLPELGGQLPSPSLTPRLERLWVGCHTHGQAATSLARL